MNFVRWEQISLQWHMNDLDHLCLDRRVLKAVLNEMVALVAFPESADSFGFTPNVSQGQVPLVCSMHAAGLVEHSGRSIVFHEHRAVEVNDCDHASGAQASVRFKGPAREPAQSI